ncbi:hypothetical protein BO94DRAFT_380387 [Aspergillus sclerotioniger CBS 115572]|uniref:Zn(2)-C6 fungal-type domain-containing protein n=1 Tax=Aspergillus sclerotioniger CBS 115572 TaxID=1450535 RepID=A0A317WZN8_9EURO|nr:hypothetical protein BO94DRAFT_380387 [Aspergillus sclerotioniger CBS 115572]PWY91813.1 hypothetical protein BO94DRAFT_380387 [Aspergillus sclerotioniger CBS 115572]
MAQQGSAKPFRPIAPRRVPEPPAPASAPEEGKIKRASTACGECKRRRTKVNPGPARLLQWPSPPGGNGLSLLMHVDVSVAHIESPCLALPVLTWVAASQCSADTTGTPCAECHLHGRDCVIDEFADKRRKVSVKRTEEALKYYRGLLDAVLETIRLADRPSVDVFVDFVRTGASYDEIQAFIAESAPNDAMSIPDGVDSGVTDSNNNSPSANSKPDGVAR